MGWSPHPEKWQRQPEHWKSPEQHNRGGGRSSGDEGGYFGKSAKNIGFLIQKEFTGNAQKTSDSLVGATKETARRRKCCNQPKGGHARERQYMVGAPKNRGKVS